MNLFVVLKRFISNEKYIEILRKQGVHIGEGCSIHKNVNFGSEPFLISIGNNTRITNGVQFITHDGSVWTLRKCGLVSSHAVLFGRIKIGDNCNIGWNSIILPNVTIGNNVIIGAGSIISKDIPDNSVVAGVPGRVLETIHQYEEKHHKQFVDTFGMSRKEKERFLREQCSDLFR